MHEKQGVVPLDTPDSIMLAGGQARCLWQKEEGKGLVSCKTNAKIARQTPFKRNSLHFIFPGSETYLKFPFHAALFVQPVASHDFPSQKAFWFIVGRSSSGGERIWTARFDHVCR